MRSLLPLAAIAATLTLSGQPAAAADQTTAAQAAERMLEGIATPEDVAAAEALIKEALASDQTNARLTLGLAAVTARQGDWPGALDLAEKAAELDPASADAHYWVGRACFEDIDNVSFLRKGAVASKGRKAFERAAELDPNHVGAHVGLANYYLQAPAIAGGSTKKGLEMARKVCGMPGGAFDGHMLLAEVAQNDKDWSTMTTEYTAAAAAAATPDEQAGASINCAYILTTTAGEHTAALEVADNALSSQPDNATLHYVRALALQALKRNQDAIAAYQHVLELNPEARSTRFNLAECYAAEGDTTAAANHYREFIERFPDDERASAAKTALDTLGN